MITNKRARELASLWYGGPWTALYRIVCNYDTRTLSIADIQLALYEISKGIYAFEENKLDLTKKERAELLHLKIWLTHQLVRRYQDLYRSPKKHNRKNSLPIQKTTLD